MPSIRSKGYICLGVKQQLTEHEYELKENSPNEVTLRVTHNGLCHSDVHMRDDDWGITGYPFIPGHELVGIVESVGSHVKGLKIGDRAGVGWLKDTCRSCDKCVSGYENLCRKGYTGTICNGNFGGFQSHFQGPADFCIKIPDGMTSSDAAPLLCAGATVYAPLKRLVKPNTKVCIVGIGGLGHLAIQFADKMGGQVTAIGRQANKAEEAKSLGAQAYVTWDEATASDSPYAGTFDVVLNCASGSASAEAMFKLLAIDGSVVVVGLPAGNPPLSVPLNDLVFNQKRLEGSLVAGRADVNEMLELAVAKGIKPMVETWPLSKVNEAMDYLLSGKARYRVVLES